MSEQIGEAIKVLRDGGIVIFPTDTAIGLGCRIDNEQALKRLFKIRKRPENKPLLALVDSLEMAKNYLSTIPEKVQDELMKPYWPGKLTIILKCNKDKIPSIARAGGDTLGIRFPNDPNLLELIKGVGVPIVAPSANFSGEKTPFGFEDLNPKLIDLADYTLTGEVDVERNVSTIIDCTVKPWKVIRQGATKIWLH